MIELSFVAIFLIAISIVTIGYFVGYFVADALEDMAH